MHSILRSRIFGFPKLYTKNITAKAYRNVFVLIFYTSVNLGLSHSRRSIPALRDLNLKLRTFRLAEFKKNILKNKIKILLKDALFFFACGGGGRNDKVANTFCWTMKQVVCPPSCDRSASIVLEYGFHLESLARK